MSTSSKKWPLAARPLVTVVWLAAVASLLVGCIVAAPPPRRAVYYPPPPPPPQQPQPPPPPPAYADSGADTDASQQVAEAPPPLPDYEQPPIPAEGYLWTPGYWAYAPGGYYWVPGTWVEPPQVGVLWTPGYWGFVGGFYLFHAGYWGPHVGFYGGVNYGYGYGGVGFAGGRWVGHSFAYNRAVTNINVTVVHNTYNERVINRTTTKVSYNGGAGGIAVAPTPRERTAAQESHVPPTPMQRQHVQAARSNPALFARANAGHPAIAATAKPAAFHGPGVVSAHGAVSPPARATPAAPATHGNIYTQGVNSVPAQQHAQTPAANSHPPAPAAIAPKAKVTAAPHPKAPPPKRKNEDNNGK
ncbi:MAG TPA: YXWGXW repeat-containing protein, partial [Steroidobacteraceae bacterium]